MRKTRNYVVVTVAAATALAVVVSGTAVGAAGDPVQKIDAKVSPSKLPKDGLKPAKLYVKTETYYEGAGGAEDTSRIPPKATKATISLPDNLEFDTKAAKQCKTDITTIGTDAAVAACNSAKVSTNKASKNGAVASLPLGPGGARVDVDANVTAFNGPKQGGNPTILLHSYIPSLNVTTVLIGVLKNARGKFGNKLVVTVPPLAGGAGAIRAFFVEIKKRFYVQGTCPRNDKKLHFAGAFKTSDAGTLKATDQSRCRPA